VRIEILNPDAPEEEQTEKRIPEPQFPTVPACSYYEMTIDLGLCQQEPIEWILFGVRIFENEWPIWAQAHAHKEIEVFPNWARVLAEYQSNIKGKVRQVPCRKGGEIINPKDPPEEQIRVGGQHRWLPKGQIGNDWVEEDEPPRIGSILGIADF